MNSRVSVRAILLLARFEWLRAQKRGQGVREAKKQYELAAFVASQELEMLRRRREEGFWLWTGLAQEGFK